MNGDLLLLQWFFLLVTPTLSTVYKIPVSLERKVSLVGNLEWQ